MKNTTKLIKANDYLLIVDPDAEIKWNDLYVDDTGTVRENFTSVTEYWKPRDGYKKIVAYYPLSTGAKELDLPLLPDPFEESISIRELALSLYNEPLNKQGEKRTQLVGHSETPFGFNKWFKAFKVGYKAAQATQLELLKRAIYLASDTENIKEITEEIIQSLSTQQLPKNFECQMYPSYPKYDGWEEDDYDPIYKPMTTTNSDGKKALIGEYKY